MNFGIVVFNQAEELDFVGPWEMLTMWSKYADGPENCLIVAQTMAPVTCAKGLSINPHVDFAACPPLDYLLVPGGWGTRQEVGNPVMLAFLEGQARHCKAVLSVCTGSFVLHAAGLLSGKRATTHWGSLERLRALCDVDVVEERFVRDGDVWTAAGVSAGMDLMLAFIASVAGEKTAGQVQFDAEYYPSVVRYGGFEAHAQAPAYIRGSEESRSISVSLDCSLEFAYDFLALPANFPKWASGLASSLREVGGEWVAETGEGAARVSFSPRNTFGVLDHRVYPGGGGEIYVPLRVVANGTGCELTLTLFRLPGMSREQFAADAQLVLRDLNAAKDLLDGSFALRTP